MKLINKISMIAGAALCALTMQTSANAQIANVWDGAYIDAQALRGENLY